MANKQTAKIIFITPCENKKVAKQMSKLYFEMFKQVFPNLKYQKPVFIEEDKVMEVQFKLTKQNAH